MIDSGRFIVIVCAVTAVMASMGYAAGAKIQALGLLSDTGDFSAADDISADGLVVVGHAGLTNNYEVFRWTEESGMVGLGISSGSRYRSLPKATSGDGSVIIGEGDNFRGFRWEEGIGMTGLGHLFTEGYGVFFDLTYDGSVMVGVHYHSPSDAIKVSAGGEVTVLAPPQAGIGAGATVVNSDGSVVAGGW